MLERSERARDERSERSDNNESMSLVPPKNLLILVFPLTGAFVFHSL